MRKNKKTLLLCVVAAAMVFSTALLPAAASAEEGSCITSECHSDMGKEKYVHGPVAAGECGICHGESEKHRDSPKRNRFGPVKDVAGICFECHDRFETKKFSHDPVEAGECTVCHDPHGSPNKFQLLSKGGELCFECHDSEIVANEFVHGPAAVGGCVACHEPHTASYEKNLKAQGPALCFMCHTDKSEAFQKAGVKHQPVTEDCTACHNPHSEAKQFMLADEAPRLCFDCHVDMEEWVSSAAVKHGALSIRKSCLNCHNAHVADIDKNLALPPMDLCLGCHNESRKRADGTMITNMKKLLEERRDHHGPIRQKDCSGCHNTHGSANFRILRESYPPTFYIPFDLDQYGLCFSCHEETLVLDPETVQLTSFRNGRTNLHFKHVNKPEKGRTCRSCHETHASDHPKHIRDSVPFGSWELPVNFEKTENGGSCTPGCHKLKKYDRVKEVVNK